MALNKKMHRRNPYRTPPSFKDLALKNEEFRQQAKIDISGKVTIDFKSADALRALTRALLKEDWGLDVILPPEYLVPTLPLRINYILWLEDLVAALKLNNGGSPVYGIDIGTGASCIYPLLAAKKNGWHMVGVEKNETALNHAKQNVLRNNFESLVKVHRNDGETIIDVSIIKNSFEPEPVAFHFTMCNPPFFASEEDVEKTHKSRSAECPRAPPHNARTGSVNEVVVEGGEVAFVSKMIDESLLVKDKVRIFSTMLGHKTSVLKLLKYLKEKNINEIATTEFCQGHVTRWGLAWSHVVQLTCELFPIDSIGAKQKPKPPMQHVISSIDGETSLSFDFVLQKIKQQMDKLNLQYQCVIKDSKSVGFQVTALTNTWSNQRRKRRQQKNDSDQAEDKITTTEASTSVSVDADKSTLRKRDLEEANELPAKRLKQAEQAPFVLMGLVLRENEIEEGTKNFTLETCWLNGCGGREAVHQILQFMKNSIR